MIKPFKHKGLEEFFYTGNKKGTRPEQSKKIAQILDRLNAANDIIDMNYPGSYLHKLSGEKKGQYSVRVSGNWRIFFEFLNRDAYIVDYGDYHFTIDVEPCSMRSFSSCINLLVKESEP